MTTHAEASRNAIGLPVQCAVVLAAWLNKSDQVRDVPFLSGAALLFASTLAADFLAASGAAAATTIILLFLRAMTCEFRDLRIPRLANSETCEFRDLRI